MTPWWLWCTWLGPYGDASEWCAWGWTVIICSFLVFVWFHAHILSCEVLPEAQNTVFQMKTFKLWSFITIWSYQPSTLQVCIRSCSGNWSGQADWWMDVWWVKMFLHFWLHCWGAIVRCAVCRAECLCRVSWTDLNLWILCGVFFFFLLSSEHLQSRRALLVPL